MVEVRAEFVCNVLDPVVISKAVYLYAASRPIASNYQNTTQQLRRNALILPRRLHSDRYFTQDWQVFVRHLQLRRTA